LIVFIVLNNLINAVGKTKIPLPEAGEFRVDVYCITKSPAQKAEKEKIKRIVEIEDIHII